MYKPELILVLDELLESNTDYEVLVVKTIDNELKKVMIKERCKHVEKN